MIKSDGVLSKTSVRANRGSNPWVTVHVAHAFDSSPFERGFVIGVRLVEVVEDPKSVPSAPRSLRCDRGGSWNDDSQIAQIVSRGNGVTHGYRSRNLGLRLVEEVVDE